MTADILGRKEEKNTTRSAKKLVFFSPKKSEPTRIALEFRSQNQCMVCLRGVGCSLNWFFDWGMMVAMF